ncbi:MAG: helix-turn-helix domain-containing protein [Clostridiaceae bacterium]
MVEKAIGDLIAKYRKQRGMTQEELGKKIGVTTQAVSRWECGGTPDVFLLPAIADTLGVNIDALFGRNTGEAVDLDELIYNRINTIPKENRFDYISRMIWTSIKSLPGIKGMQDMKYLENSMESIGVGEKSTWMRSCIVTDDGFALGVPAEDYPFFAVFPEPKDGFDSLLSLDEEYQKLFEVLGRPNHFRVLRYLYQHDENYYISVTVAKKLSIDIEEAENILSELHKINLLKKRSLELEDKTVPTYIVHSNGSLVPFLIFAKWIMDPDDSWQFRWDTRKKPYLNMEVIKHGKK